MNIEFSEKTLSRFNMGVLQNNQVTFYGKNYIMYSREYEKMRKVSKCYINNGVIFPIEDPFEVVVSFSIRNLDHKSGKGIKYYMFGFKKTFYLGGLSMAMKNIIEKDSVFIVEGFKDWIAMFENGIDNVVFVCGSSLSDMQIALLNSMTSNFVLAGDGDKEGQRFNSNSINRIKSKLGKISKKIVFPEEHDPYSFLQENSMEELYERVL